MFDRLPNIGKFEIFAGVGLKDSESRSQNVGSTGSAFVLIRFPLVDANFFFDISASSLKMRARLPLTVFFGFFALYTLVTFSQKTLRVC